MGRKKGVKNTTQQAIARFEKTIDKNALRLFLEEQDIPRYQLLFGMLSDAAYAKLSFKDILRRSGVSLSDLQVIYTDGMRHMGLLQMMQQLPSIMADVAQDARTTDTPCPRCDAVGFVPFGDNGERTCPVCNGSKYVRKTGDKHARDLVFQSAKLTGQGAPMVNIHQSFEIGDARMESLMKKTREIVLEPHVPQMIEDKNGHNED